MSRKLPTAMHEMKGTARSDRQHPDEPRVDSGDPAMPPDLTEKEQAAWHYCIGLIRALGVLTPADALALESLACTLVEVRELRQAVVSSPTHAVVSKQKESVDRLHPLYPMYQQSRKELRALWACFGLDPQARTEVHTVTPPPKSKAAPATKSHGNESSSAPQAGTARFFNH